MSNRIFGLAPQDCIGNLAFDLVHPDDKERTRKWFDEKIATHKIRGTIENRQVGRNGEIHHMLWTTNIHYDNDGNLINVSSIARDITERKQAEGEKEKLQTQLQQSQKMEAIGNLWEMGTFLDKLIPESCMKIDEKLFYFLIQKDS